MGNMELVPGSHRSQVRLPQEVIEAKDEVPIGHVICARAGSVLVFHNAVWHRTYVHNGDQDRYTAHYIYSPPWVRSADRFENSPDFLERTTPLAPGPHGRVHPSRRSLWRQLRTAALRWTPAPQPAISSRTPRAKRS